MIRYTPAAILLALTTAAGAQAIPTGLQLFRLSAFAGASGVFTGLGSGAVSGRNLSLTGGVDLGLPPLFHFEPTVEVRGTYPLADGAVDNERNILGGVRVARRVGLFRPYVNFLVGAGRIDFSAPGYIVPSGNFLLLSNTSTVYSPGVGVDYALTRSFGLKADAQLEHYNTPAAVSGSINSKVLTVGIIYHLHF